MTDVRLTATNPEDSSVVPVACNAKGELLLEETPGFDGNVDGDLTVSGSATFAKSISIPAKYEDRFINALVVSYNFSAANDPANYRISAIINAKGDLTLNSEGITDSSDNKVILNAATGSATFAGNVFSGPTVSNDVNYARLAGSQGAILVNSPNDQTTFRSLKSGVDTITMSSTGSATFAADIQSGNPTSEGRYTAYSPTSSSTDDAVNIFRGSTALSSRTVNIKYDGSATFTGDVVVGSRGKKWTLLEQGGLCHMVEQTKMTDLDEYPDLRDVLAELDLVEQALSQVMEKLRMSPPSGWPVWDGSDEIS